MVERVGVLVSEWLRSSVLCSHSPSTFAQAMIILDDDTFLNWRIVNPLLAHFLEKDSPSEPLFVGEIWRQILLGGAGYIILKNGKGGVKLFHARNGCRYLLRTTPFF